MAHPATRIRMHAPSVAYLASNIHVRLRKARRGAGLTQGDVAAGVDIRSELVASAV